VSTAADEVLTPAKTNPLPRQTSKAAITHKQITSNQFRLNHPTEFSKASKTTPQKNLPIYRYNVSLGEGWFKIFGFLKSSWINSRQKKAKKL
jgi:hypothetical protein